MAIAGIYQHLSEQSMDVKPVRRWRSFDIDTFVADLQRSALVNALPEDVTAAFNCYNSTLRLLLDRYAPCIQRPQRLQSARRFDQDCRIV